MADTLPLRLPEVSWPGHALQTVRSVTYLYLPGKRVKAFWGYGRPPAQAQFGVGQGENAHLVSTPQAFLALKDDPDFQIAVLKESLSRLPDAARAFQAHFQLGLILRRKKDLDGAIAEFRETIRLQPDFAEAHANLASALDDKGDRAGAVGEYRELVRIHPDDADAHYTLGAQLEAQATIESLAKPKSAAPKAGGNRTATDRAKAAQQDFLAALEEYRIAHKLVPANSSYGSAYERLARKLRGK